MEMVNTKTWTKTRIAVTGADNDHANRNLLIAIKNHMISNGWSVVFSSNSTIVGADDYWSSSGDIVNAIPGSVHSWIVLSNNSICSGYQLCIDCGLATVGMMYFFVSINGTGFTGGSTTARPTATDEKQLNINTDYWTSYSSGTGPSANIWISSDYSATKIVLGPTTVRGVWWFVQPIDAPDWWEKPNLSMVNFGTCIHTDHDTTSEMWSGGIVNDLKAEFGLGTIMIGTTRALTTAGVAGAAGDYGGNWPVSPMWVLGSNASSPGILGFVPDQWWTHNNASLALGDTFPGDSSRQQVVIGNMAFGNDGTTLTL
jgi:hypothetical protein